MSFVVFCDIIKRLVHGIVYRLYYCPIRTPLNVGLKELKTNSDVRDFVRVGYENQWYIDLYMEHFDYDIMDFIKQEANGVLGSGSSDEYYSSDEIEEFDEVDFQTEGEENVVIKNLTTHDPFLNKLYGNNRLYRDYLDDSVLETEGEALDDPDAADIDPSHKFAKSPKSAKSGQSGKSGKHAKSGQSAKSRIKKKVSFSQPIQTSNKRMEEGCSNDGEGTSKSQPPKSPQTLPKWTKKKIMDAKKNMPVCGFRLWASWMNNEHSFQIKSLHEEHKCSRNYKLGSLVTYKWIAYHFSKEIINDPFIPYIKIKDQIRQKFLIDVCLGQ
ncbi:hypothetical protein Tco_1564460 [Tanacetum coccineum]